MNKPNFLIVGAAKSGTTTLYEHLVSHPNINLSIRQKEGRFFSGLKGNYNGPRDKFLNKLIPKDFEEYISKFDDKPNANAMGDISPEYLYYFDNTIKSVQKLIDRDLSNWQT